MKRFIPLCTIFVSFSSFANDHSPITHEKLAFAAEEFNKEISQNLSLNLTQTVCGTIGCKSEITKNNAILSDVVFSGEINNSTNVSKINIDVTNRFDYTSNTLSYVCLSNNECKFYGPEEIQKANALHFKRNSKIQLPENKKQEIINNIKNLDIGTVEYIRVTWLGYLIEVTLKDK